MHAYKQTKAGTKFQKYCCIKGVPIIRYRQWFETSINDYDSQNIDSSTLYIDSASQYIELFSKNYYDKKTMLH